MPRFDDISTAASCQRAVANSNDEQRRGGPACGIRAVLNAWPTSTQGADQDEGDGGGNGREESGVVGTSQLVGLIGRLRRSASQSVTPAGTQTRMRMNPTQAGASPSFQGPARASVAMLTGATTKTGAVTATITRHVVGHAMTNQAHPRRNPCRTSLPQVRATARRCCLRCLRSASRFASCNLASR